MSSPPVTASIRSRLGLLRQPNFTFLLIGRTCSFGGDAIGRVALAFAVLDVTGSVAALGTVLAASFVPQVLFTLLAGVWADRLPRHRIMAAADLVSCASQAVAALLLLTHHAQLWQLVVIAVVNGSALAVFFPASQSVIPRLIAGEHLQDANAVLRLTQNLAMVAGASLGGLVVAATQPGWAMLLDSLSFAISALCCSLLRPEPVTAHRRARMWSELRAGWQEFRSRTWLWAVVCQFAVVNTARTSGFLLLGPVVARDRLGGAAAWGLLLAAESAGQVSGGAVSLLYHPSRPLLAGTIAILLRAPVLFGLAVGLGLGPLLPLAWAAGLAGNVFVVQWAVTCQEHVPPEVLARVVSYDVLGSYALIPAGYLVAGPVAATVGTGPVILAAAMAIVVPTVLILLTDDVRRLRRLQPARAGSGVSSAAAASDPPS